MELLKNWLHGKYNVINLIILTFFFIGSCFNAVFIIFLSIFAFFSCIFNKNTTYIFGLLIFIRLFRFLFYWEGIQFLSILSYAIALVLYKNFIFDLINKKIRLEWKVLVSITVFLVFITIVSSLSSTLTFSGFASELFFLSYLFFAYQYRKDLSFVTLVRMLSCAVIISTILSLFNRIFPNTIYICNDLVEDGYTRLSGLLLHPNHLLANTCIALSGLLLAKYHENISTLEFIFLFIILFVIGLKSYSRSYIFSLLPALLLFFIFYLRKHKLRGLAFALNFFAILLAICLLFIRDVNILLFRTSSFYELNMYGSIKDLTAEQLRQILNGEVQYDPGRIGIYYLYSMQIFSSPIKFLFGFGIGAPAIGQMHAHNILLYFVYRFGFIGLILVGVIVLTMLGKLKFSALKKHLPCLTLIFGFYGISMFDGNQTSVTPYAIFIAYICAQQKSLCQRSPSADTAAMHYKLLSHRPFSKFLSFEVH